MCVSERERVVGKKLASGGLTVPLLLEVPLNVGIEESNVHLYGCGHDPAREKKKIYIYISCQIYSEFQWRTKHTEP